MQGNQTCDMLATQQGAEWWSREFWICAWKLLYGKSWTANLVPREAPRSFDRLGAPPHTQVPEDFAFNLERGF